MCVCALARALTDCMYACVSFVDKCVSACGVCLCVRVCACVNACVLEFVCHCFCTAVLSVASTEAFKTSKFIQLRRLEDQENNESFIAEKIQRSSREVGKYKAASAEHSHKNGNNDEKWDVPLHTHHQHIEILPNYKFTT